ncbi:hypothetical protein NZ698_03230 [Chryseobacterium sp. PBS4-4]|uniref:Uncharacterized protein n=1 Tax=Chryseobacterium edaphi TaxID=2976532 RepID=A0ABT2W2G7_9FLAO|nr:hypothetical protein [Chryseobacterium edaphi]MCU7616200.1 hypothetical protein [Chryseobacterium edaphi]
MKNKIFIVIILVIILYYIISLLIFGGNFTMENYYSYNSIEEAKQNKTFTSSNLDITIEGDSLQNVSDLKNKFYLSKSTFQKFYGFLISFDMEDERYRRIIWEEPIKQSLGRNWVIEDEKGNYLGEAFYKGHYDGELGEEVTLLVKNPKSGYKIGEIKIQIK